MKKTLISVDAGGSSTRVAIIEDNKKIIEVAKTGCGSPAVLNNEEEAFANIEAGVDKVIKHCHPLVIVMGVSGVEIVRNKQKYVKYFQEKYQTKVLIENDVVLAIYSLVTDKYQEGVLVLSGTGSAVMSIKDMKTRLIGGWGHLLTEVGSAYTTSRDFFISLISNYESNNQISPLGNKFMQKYRLTRIEDLKFLVYQKTKKDIALYANFITKEASFGDKEAISILKKGARDLARDVKNAIKALNLSSNAVIGFRGGFITNTLIVQEELIASLENDGYKLRIVHGDENPLYGGYYLAKRMGYLC